MEHQSHGLCFWRKHSGADVGEAPSWDLWWWRKRRESVTVACTVLAWAPWRHGRQHRRARATLSLVCWTLPRWLLLPRLRNNCRDILHTRPLLPAWRKRAAALRGGLVLDSDRPDQRHAVQRDRAGLLRDHGQQAADTLQPRHGPAQREHDHVRQVRRRQVPGWQGPANLRDLSRRQLHVKRSLLRAVPGWRVLP